MIPLVTDTTRVLVPRPPSVLPVAVGSVEARVLAGEADQAHSGLGHAAAARPGLGDGIAHASVLQPAAVAAVVALETPGSVKMADQGQLSPLELTGALRLREGEGARQVEDGACGRTEQ